MKTNSSVFPMEEAEATARAIEKFFDAMKAWIQRRVKGPERAKAKRRRKPHTVAYKGR